MISAVGHEPDVTIADFVADLRAATPSNGAELCVPDISELGDALEQMDIRAYRAISGRLDVLRKQLDDLSTRRVIQRPESYIDDKKLLLDHMQERMTSAAERQIAKNRNSYIALASKLDALSPLKVLGRGFSITEDSEGKVIKSKDDVDSGDKLVIKFKDGNVRVTAD